MRRVKHILLTLALFGGLSSPAPVLADITQLDHSVEQQCQSGGGGGSCNFSQTLGTGLSGVYSGASLWTQDTTANTFPISLDLYECSTEAYGSSCTFKARLLADPQQTGAGGAELQFSTTTPFFQFDPTKYYGWNAQISNGFHQTVYFYGSDSKISYPGGEATTTLVTFGGSQDPGSIADFYFKIVGTTYEPPELDPVIIIPGILGSWQKNDAWIIDPVFGIYNDLIDTLEANGYVEEQNLFTFPYEWRNSNVETAQLLAEKIDDVQEICSCDKVDLVAHSMGGLVARQYIQSDYYGDNVDQMIFLGTPHLGAPKAYLMWEQEKLMRVFIEFIMSLIFKNEAQT